MLSLKLCPPQFITEPIEISFALENTIKPSIIFEDINLLWTFTTDTGETFTNLNLFNNDVTIEERESIFNIVAPTFIKLIQLNEHEKKVVVMKLTPRLTGQLDIKAVVGKISVGRDFSSKFGRFYMEQWSQIILSWLNFVIRNRQRKKHPAFGANWILNRMSSVPMDRRPLINQSNTIAS